jgi:hypothetical protein
MSKAISYALFGSQENRVENCFDFFSYKRSLMINLRMNRLLYPDWEVVVHTDLNDYTLNILHEQGLIRLVKCQSAPLCKAMLWRMKPIFEVGIHDGKKYTHVLCRDLDSPPTYREVQAVEYWMSTGKSVHAITDSVSHDVPLLGGMIGFVPKDFTMRTGWNSWDELMGQARSHFENKGSDQAFLTQVVYPIFANKGSESIVQHYFNGFSNTFLSEYHTCTCPPPSGHRSDCPNNYPINLPDELKETNSVCGHIGSSGAYSSEIERFMYKYRDRFIDLYNIEKDSPEIFYWVNQW